MAEEAVAEDITKESETLPMTKLDRAFNLVKVLATIQDSIDRLYVTEKRFEMMLHEPSLLFRFRKDWVAFFIASRLYTNYKTKAMKAEEISSYVDKIRLHDPKFAEKVEKVLPRSQQAGIFSDLLNALKKGYLVAYISTHFQELIAKAKSIQDAKLSARLVALFSSISGHEVEYLVKYRLDVENWLHYAVGYDIDFFIRRIGLFLNCGIEGDIRFVGLYKDFGDKDLRMAMAKNNEVRNLWLYRGQIAYLNRLIEMCKTAQKDPKWWKGFYEPKGFWADFDKYAKAFETVYGNTDFASRLIGIKRKTENELPHYWGGTWEKREIQGPNAPGGIREEDFMAKSGVLPNLSAELQSRSYKVNRIMHPAAVALQRILREREEQLKADREKHVNELIRLLEEVEGIAKVTTKFLRLLRKTRRPLIRGLTRDIEIFRGVTNKPLTEYIGFLEELYNSISKMEYWYIEERTSKLVNAAQAYRKYIQHQLRTGQFLDDITVFTLMGFADRMAVEASNQRLRYEGYEHLSEDDFKKLEELIQRAKIIERKLRQIALHIQLVLRTKYTIKPKNINELAAELEKSVNLNQRKNKTLGVGYIKRTVYRYVESLAA